MASQSIPLPLHLSCDDAYFSLFIQTETETETEAQTALFSDHDYAVELQLQEVIMSSSIPPKTRSIPTKDEPGNYAVKSQLQEAITSFLIPPKPTPIPIMKEPGESSRPLCEICAESKDTDAFFPIPNCAHKFCTDCISRHISVTIRQKNILHLQQVLPCPGPACDGVLEMDTCRRILSKDVVAMLDDVLCEAMIESWERFYCPYKECSALLVKDEEGIREAECPACHRLVCVRCNVPWHQGMGCEEYANFGEEEREQGDLMVHNMAKKNLWGRCGVCGFYVERNEGCLHMTCRCGNEFCYGCGKIWGRTHVCNAEL